jgi:DNA-directed RNA polymerase subunit E'/Rpb7
MSNKNVTINDQIQTPYINTTLICPIMLYPNQMDNKRYLHLKTNLTNKLLGRCYKNYGYISEIYQIIDESEGIIEDEDPSCSSKIIVKFSCRLCIPAKNKEIICKIDRMNKVLISAINGPIKVIITPDKLEKANFYSDINRNIRIKKNSEVLIPDMYIRVLILSYSFSDYDDKILAIGYLQNIANDNEIELYNKE